MIVVIFDCIENDEMNSKKHVIIIHKIQMTQESPSSLPPLSPHSNPSFVANETNPSPKSPIKKDNISDLKDKIKHLYPRVQNIEKQIDIIKSQVPGNLKKTILGFKMQLSSLNIGSTSNNQNIFHLEAEIRKYINEQIEETENEIQKRMAILNKKDDELLLSSLFIDDDILSDELEQATQSIEDILFQYKKYSQQKIEAFERKLSKVLVPPSDFQEDLISPLSSQMDANQKQISLMKSKIESLKHSFSGQAQTKEISINHLNETSSMKKSHSSSKPIKEVPPDFTVPIQKLSTDLDNIISDFTISINELNQQQNRCNETLAIINQTTIDLINNTSDFENRVTRSKQICQNLFDQVKLLSEKSDDTITKENLLSLSSQIQDIHDSLHTEIVQIKTRIQNIEV